MRGFIGGLAIGLVTVVLGVVAMTLLWPAGSAPIVTDAAPTPTKGGVVSDQSADVVSAVTDNDLIQVMPTGPQDPGDARSGTDAGQDTLAMLDPGDTRPAGKPSVSGAAPLRVDPDTGPATSDVAIGQDAPVAIMTPLVRLPAPTGDNEPGALANPAQPVVPNGAQSGEGFGLGTADQDQSPVIAGANDPVPSGAVGSTGGQVLAPAGSIGTAPAVVLHTTPDPAVEQPASPEIGATSAEQEGAPIVTAISDPAPSTATPGAGLTAPGDADGANLPVVPAQPASDITIAGVQGGAAPTLGTGEGREDATPQVSSTTDAAPSTPPTTSEPSAPGQDQSVASVDQSDSQPASQSQVVAGLAPAPAVGQSAPVSPTAPTGAQIAATPSVLPAPTGDGAAVPDVDQSARAKPETAAPSDSQVSALPQAGAEEGGLRPRIGKRVVPLTERNAARQGVVRVVGEAAPAPEPTRTSETSPPLQANSEPFENPENRPLMSIVLIDTDDSLGIEALAEFPYPVSFAIDPGDPDAAAKMARHRAAGFEVVLITDLPRLASAQDAETSLSVWLNELPEAVALLEGTKTGIQGNRDLSDQVTAIADQSGLGLIMQARGLNTAYKLAARDGVPAALVFRDFDGAGQTPVVMRRFLDQAAFRAGQQGGVIMLGRLQPDTISALLIWGLQDRISRVALAPVSALLTQE